MGSRFFRNAFDYLARRADNIVSTSCGGSMSAAISPKPAATCEVAGLKKWQRKYP